MIVSEIIPSTRDELLKAKIGEKEAEAFVEILETRVDKKFEEAEEILATKEYIAHKHNDLLKWMIIMWITQLGAIVAIIKLL